MLELDSNLILSESTNIRKCINISIWSFVMFIQIATYVPSPNSMYMEVYISIDTI